MKTNLKKLFLVVAVAVPFMFTSCVETDDRATITLTTPAQGTSVTIDANGHFLIAGEITSPEGTRIDDIMAQVVSDHVHTVASNASGDNTFTGSGNRFLFSINQTHPALAAELAKIQAEENAPDYVILRFTASVRNGGAPRELNVTINFHQEVDPTTPLSESRAFALRHPAHLGSGDVSTANGIQWQQNPTGTTARFIVQHIVLNASQFNAITTVEELEAAAEGGTFATQIDVTAGSNLTHYWIVRDGATLRLVHLSAVSMANFTANFTERH